MKTGAELIAEERERQISEEGWTEAHDDQHNEGELVAAAACYAQYASITAHVGPNATRLLSPPPMWPWERHWWKPSEDVRCLVKAGALIAAEIDRLQRQPSGSTTTIGEQEGGS